MTSIRNIPYGLNANYETVIKIIGSKYVRCLVEKTDGNAKEGVKTETQSMLRTLTPHNARRAHGNLPGLNRPLCQQIHYGLIGEQHNKGEREEQRPKQEERSDSRSVDRKGLKPLNTHCVTAPSGDKSLSYIHTLQKPSMEKQLERQQDIAQKPMDEENDSLLGILRKDLEQCPLNLTTFEKLQEECKVWDPRASRLLPQAQLSHLFLKHEVPLQLPTVKLLFKRFSTANDQELVNYEKLLKFIMPVVARKSQNTENHRESSWTPEDAFQALKQTLKEHKGELSLLDKTCSDLLSPSEAESICRKHGLTLPTGILEVLVSPCEFGKRGKIQWKTFVEFLKKVQAGINPALLVCRRRNKDKGEDDSQDKEWSNRYAVKPWEQMKDTYDSIHAEEQDVWIDRFRKLERALYLCDMKNTGKLEKEKAKRLIHNYNQIYNLCLSPLKIDKAFRPFRPGQDIPLEPLLNYLKEL